MNIKQTLSTILVSKKIEHTIDRNDDPSIQDDSITIKTPSKDGHEISVQIVNDSSDRSQKNYIVGFYNKEKGLAADNGETNSAEIVVQEITDLINNPLPEHFWGKEPEKEDLKETIKKITKNRILKAVSEKHNLVIGDEIDLYKSEGFYYWGGKAAACLTEMNTYFNELNHPNIPLERWVGDFDDKVEELLKFDLGERKSIRDYVNSIEWDLKKPRKPTVHSLGLGRRNN